VLVVDGGASHRCALLGDNIAEMAHKNGWSVSDCGGLECQLLVFPAFEVTAVKFALLCRGSGHHHQRLRAGL
jgi:hypothetical protein